MIFVLIYFIVTKQGLPQTWPRNYFPSENSTPHVVTESYDRGFLIGGDNYDSHFGYIIKTDINGNPLWNKKVGLNNDTTTLCYIQQTYDGGIIISGAKTSIDPALDVFFAKTDPCLILEWCKMYSSNFNQFDYGKEIYEIPGGYIALVEQFGDEIVTKRIWLFKLDMNGNILWQQFYGNTSPLIENETGCGLTITLNQKYIINGFCYYPDSGTTQPLYLRPFIVKVDSNGIVDWELPWSSVYGESFHGESYQAITDNNNIIYSCGRHIESSSTPPGDRPTMLKTDANGNELSYHDLIPNTWQAVFYNINWFQDSTIEIDGGWSFSPTQIGQIGVYKIDKNGNILDSANIVNSIYCFTDAIIDQDDKIFLVQGPYINNQWHTYAWKLNSDLEYDTLYTQPMVYDSLCPYPIASDTIPLDCEVVGLDEPFTNPETSRLKVYPNPASDILHIGIPEKLKTETSTPAFNITTVYHQWRSAAVEVYDLFGRRVFSKEVTPADKELSIDVSAWHAGMYVVRLVYLGRKAGSEKVVME
jgi:hypothetical protein